jgi:uncharacterized repeat protein (TIGR01451 family)
LAVIVVGSLMSARLASAQTDSIPLATIGTAPPTRTGTLPNGVTWSVDRGTWHAGGQGYIIFGGQTQTWTFDRPVSLRFSVRGLTGPDECVQVPPGSVLVSVAPSHSYNPTTRLVCFTANVPTADSFFTLGPTTSLVLNAVNGPSLGRGPGSIEVTFTEEPALSIVKSSTTVTIPPLGVTIPYSFLVTNTGNVPMTDVAVSDPNTTGVSCPLTTLALSESMTCTGSHTVVQGDVDAGEVVNTAMVVGTPPSGTPIAPVPSNQVTITGLSNPALSILKASTTTQLPPLDDTIPYTFLVTNIGDVTITGIAVTDVKTTGVSCPATTLAPGISTTCTGSHTIVQGDIDAGEVVNTATVAGTTPGGLPILPVLSNQITIGVAQTESLSILKSSTNQILPAVGVIIPYEFLVTNTGNVTMTGIAVTDPNASGISCPLTTLSPSASTSCTATHTATQADIDSGAVTNTATVVGTPPDGTPIPPIPSNEVTITGTQNPAVSIVKASTTTTVTTAGQTVPYTFTVTNTGDVTITEIAVSDPTTAGATCPQTTLDPGISTICTATHTVTATDLDSGQLVNTATVTGTRPTGPPIPAVLSNTVTIPAAQSPSLSIVKSTTTTQATAAGQVARFTFLVTNTGNVTMSDIVVSDPNVELVDCPQTTLAARASMTCTANYTITAADVTAGHAINTATVVATPPGGRPIPPVVSNRVRIAIPPTAAPSTTTSPTSTTSTTSTTTPVPAQLPATGTNTAPVLRIVPAALILVGTALITISRRHKQTIS